MRPCNPFAVPNTSDISHFPPRTSPIGPKSPNLRHLKHFPANTQRHLRHPAQHILQIPHKHIHTHHVRRTTTAFKARARSRRGADVDGHQVDGCECCRAVLFATSGRICIEAVLDGDADERLGYVRRSRQPEGFGHGDTRAVGADHCMIRRGTWGEEANVTTWKIHHWT